jgi:hypothetical protein
LTPQKVCKLENCLARPCLACSLRAAQPFGLHRVGVPRIIHNPSAHVKPIFEEFFIIFAHFSQNIDNTTQKFCIFLHKIASFLKIDGIYARKVKKTNKREHHLFIFSRHI